MLSSQMSIYHNLYTLCLRKLLIIVSTLTLLRVKTVYKSIFIFLQR